MRLVCLQIKAICFQTGLICEKIGLDCSQIRPICSQAGLVCPQIRLICPYIVDLLQLVDGAVCCNSCVILSAWKKTKWYFQIYLGPAKTSSFLYALASLTHSLGSRKHTWYLLKNLKICFFGTSRSPIAFFFISEILPTQIQKLQISKEALGWNVGFWKANV